MLAGANVIIVADNDVAGYAHVAQSLLSTTATITVAEAKIGKDAAEHLGAGCSVEDISVIASTAPASNERSLAAGLISPVDEPDPAESEAPPQSSADHLRSRLMTTEQIRTLPPPAPLIDGYLYLYLDSLAVLYGSSGVGKTHVTVDMAMSITSQDWWFGRRVTRGVVLYVVAEGASGIGIRTDADENSARDVGQAIAHLDMIRKAAGSCVLVVHHSGKDKSAGARGSTALKGALNTELEVVGGEGQLTLRNPKQKDAPEQPPLHLMLQPVPGTTSVVVVEAARTRPSSPATWIPSHRPARANAVGPVLAHVSERSMPVAEFDEPSVCVCRGAIGRPSSLVTPMNG